MSNSTLHGSQRPSILIAVVALALAAGAAGADAATPAAQAPPLELQSVSGTVTDSTGAVIVGAEVNLRERAGKVVRSTSSNARGRYQLDRVPLGSYLVDAFRDGFGVVTQELRVAAGEPPVLDFRLSPASFSEEITVAFTGEHAQTALKSDAPVRDIPLTVKSYTGSFMKAVDTKQVSDLYTYMNGVNRAGDTAYDFTMRGFEATDPGNIQYNGMNGLAARMNSPNVVNIERIEVLKGPASVLYGQTNPGGIVNLITERPQTERQHLFDFRTGTFFGTGPGFGDRNSFRASANFTGPLGSSTKFLYRFVASYDNTKSFRDFVEGDEVYIVPSFSWNVSEGTLLTVEGEYRRIEAVFDNGLIAPRNDIRFLAPITTLYQEPDDTQNESGLGLSVFFTKLFAGGVNWNVNWRTVLHDDDRLSFENNRVENDNRRVRRRDRHQVNSRTYHYLDTTVRRPFTTGSVGHNLLVGLNGGFEQSDFDRLRFGNVGFFVDLRNPVYGAVRPANPNPGTHLITDYRRLGLYVQDQINFSPKWKGLASVRYDTEHQKIKEVRFNNPGSDNTVGAAVPTAGLVFQPDHRWSIYASYSQSFNPPPASAQDAEGNNEFDPEKGRQLEGGVKLELAGGKLDATAAVFRITKDNVLVSVGGGISEQIGQQRSTGLELDLRLRPVGNWQSILGYTYIDGEVTEDRNPMLIGARLRNTPRHAFNLWSRYDVRSGAARGLGLGLGLIWRGDRAGSFPSQVVLGNPIPGEPFPSEVLELPGYFRTDAGVYYVRGRYELTLRVNNVADKLYYESAFNLIRIRPGNPREASLSVRLRF